MLEFGPAGVHVRPDDEDIKGRTIRYDTIKGLSYAQKQWKKLLFKGMTRWLTVKGSGVDLVLRLDSKNYTTIIAEFEARTGLATAGKEGEKGK